MQGHPSRSRDFLNFFQIYDLNFVENNNNQIALSHQVSAVALYWCDFLSNSFYLAFLLIVYYCADCRANIARFQPAYQSSTYHVSGERPASRAVDGGYSTNGYSACSITADGAGGPNWWTVDLGQPVFIDYVRLLNRIDFGQWFFSHEVYIKNYCKQDLTGGMHSYKTHT